MLRSSPAASSDHGRHHHIDPHDRFSQFSDTPSVYSPAHFSPRHDYDYGSHRLDGHDSSALHFDDGLLSSIAADDTHTFEEPTGDRLSYLGPKMRFHSRAPWEMDGGILEEEDERVLPKSPRPVFPFSLARPAQSSNPPQSVTSRPSGESFRSHVMPKRSFDTINSQLSSKGALYALAQESLSSASLAKGGPSTQKDGLLGKITSLGRSRVQPVNNTPPPTSPSTSPHRSPFSSRVPLLPRHPLDKRTCSSDYDTLSSNRSRFTTDRPSSSSQEGAVHPYANPDLISVADTDSNLPRDSRPSLPIRNDSSVTVTQKFASESTSSRTSLTSFVPHTPGGRKRISSVQGREISSPVAVQGTSLPLEVVNQDGQHPGVSHLPGWTEKFVPPAFNLISLEEARAQRVRNLPTGDASNPSIAMLFFQSTMTLNNDDAFNSSTGTRSRGRTISAGAKAKNAFHSMVGSVPERRDSEPALLVSQSHNVSQLGKPLKHKKSGFMRMFNGGKDKEPDGPLPPLPFNSASSDMITLKKVPSRVPVPSLSPSFDSVKFTDSAGPKRSPPVLHIDTIPQTSQAQVSMRDRHYQQRTMTSFSPPDVPKPWNASYPQSAPADATGFPALKLRPVSGLFSSHFEHIVPDFQESGADTPVSSSPTGLSSPITPGNVRFSRSDVGNQAEDIKSSRSQEQSAASQALIGELEGQLRDLKAELYELRARQHQDDVYCSACGRGRNCSPPRERSLSSASSASSGNSVVNRPRAKTGTGTTARFVNGLA